VGKLLRTNLYETFPSRHVDRLKSVSACGSFIVNNHFRGSISNSLFKEVKPAIIKKSKLTSWRHYRGYNQDYNLQFANSVGEKKSGGANSNNMLGKPPHITKSGGAKTWFFKGAGSIASPPSKISGGAKPPKPPRDLHPCLDVWWLLRGAWWVMLVQIKEQVI